MTLSFGKFVFWGGAAILILVVIFNLNGKKESPEEAFRNTDRTPIPAAPAPARRAGDLKYDPDEAQHEAMFNQLAASTGVCMNEGERAMLQRGVRESEQLALQAGALCGGPMRKFMMETLKMSENDATTMLYALAVKQMALIPGLQPNN